MFSFLFSNQTKALQQRLFSCEQALEAAQTQINALESYIHSDAFHELLDERFFAIYDESKFEDLAQDAIERCISSAALHVRF